MKDGLQGLDKFVREGAEFSESSPGAPISYELRYLDGSIAVAGRAVDFRKRDCRRVGQQIRVELEGITGRSTNDGPTDNEVELYGHVWAEATDPTDEQKKKKAYQIYNEPEGHALHLRAGGDPWKPPANNYYTILDVAPGSGESITLKADLWEKDDGWNPDDNLGPRGMSVSYGNDWYSEQELLVTNGGITISLHFKLEPI